LGRSIRELEQYIVLAKKYGITTMSVDGVSFTLPKVIESPVGELKEEKMPSDEDLLFYSSEVNEETPES